MADEKFDEKEMEKQEEKGAEKWARDPVSTVVWAAIFIWAGLVLLASTLGYLQQLGDLLSPLNLTGIAKLDQTISAWPLIFLGAGVILLLEALVRLLVPAYRRSVTGTIILGFVFIGIGLSSLGLINWSIIIAFIFIGLGLSFLVRGFSRSGSG